MYAQQDHHSDKKNKNNKTIINILSIIEQDKMIHTLGCVFLTSPCALSPNYMLFFV